MTDADTHPALIFGQVIHPVGNGFAAPLIEKIIDPHLRRLAGPMVFGPGILEIAKVFLLLGIHRDDRLSRRVIAMTFLLDIFILFILIYVLVDYVPIPI